MTGNVKNWKSFNEAADYKDSLDVIKDFDTALTKLTYERNIRFLEYLSERFKAVNLTFTYDHEKLSFSLNASSPYVNNIPMRFSNTGSTLYFEPDSPNFPKALKGTKLVEKGYRSAEAILIALNKALGLNKNAKVGPLIKTGLLD